MYKGAHQVLVHRTAVDRPHPSRGYIDGGPDPTDVLAAASSLTMTQAKEEKSRLACEMSRLEQELAVAKVGRRYRAIAAIGQRKATIQDRLKAINARIRELNTALNGNALSAAIREIVDADTAARIFARCKELCGSSGVQKKGAEL